MRDHALRRVKGGQQKRVLGLAKQVDVQLQPAALDVRACPDTFTLPVDDRPARRRLGRATALDELLEPAKQLDSVRVLPLQIRLDACEVGPCLA
jgi:hypothetical protein